MAKITIEDEGGYEKVFHTSEGSAEKVKSCLMKKQKEDLGPEKSSTVYMIDDDGDKIGFFLQRDESCDDSKGMVMSLKTFNATECEDESEAEDECRFEQDGNNLNVDNHYFS